MRSTGSQVRLLVVDIDITFAMSSFIPYSYVVGSLSASTLEDKIKLKLAAIAVANCLSFLLVISHSVKSNYC